MREVVETVIITVGAVTLENLTGIGYWNWFSLLLSIRLFVPYM